MADRVAAGNGDGVFGTNGGRLDEQGVSDFLFDLLDFLNCLFLSQVVELCHTVSHFSQSATCTHIQTSQHPRQEQSLRDNIGGVLSSIQHASPEQQEGK